MKHIINYLAFCLIITLGISCSKKIDNYAGPTETLKGSIIDSNTNKPLQSEVSGDNGKGTRIKLLETSWSDDPTPLYLATKQDGTFNNSKIFAATYKISAEGAFVPLVQTQSDGTVIVDKSQTVTVKGGTTTVNFTVEPFLEVEWVGDPILNSDGTITANVKITRGTANPDFQSDITDVNLFINNTEYVGNNNYDNRYAKHINYNGPAGNNILGDTLSLTTTNGALPKGRDYFVRVGARINYGLKQYNYNEPKKVTVP